MLKVPAVCVTLFFCLYLTYGRWASTCSVTNPTYCTVAILPVITNNIPIFPRVLCLPIFYRQPMVEFHFLHVLTLSATDARIKILLLNKNQTHDFGHYNYQMGMRCYHWTTRKTRVSVYLCIDLLCMSGRHFQQSTDHLAKLVNPARGQLTRE